MASTTCYISAASSASATRSIRQEHSAPFSTTVSTQIPPNRKALRKWAAAVAPTDPDLPIPPPDLSKLRKYWGGNNEDPLTSDDYIWNKDFMDRFKKMIQDPASDSPASGAEKEADSGFLSLNRVMNLDSLEVDLSKELAKPVKSKKSEKPVELPARKSKPDVPKWRLAPTRREQDKWDKASKAATGGTDVLLREAKKPRGDPLVLAAQSREQYFELKNKMQNQTIAIGAVGLVSSFISYSPEIAVSFGAGLVGSLMYVRMLGNTVDGMADGARGAMKGSVNQPRLLVPVALVMIFNRWNGIIVPEYGFMQLELIPMLVGFFTYKIATFVQAIEESLPTNTKSDQI